MQVHDPPVANPRSSDLRSAAMADSSEPSSPSPIHSPADSQENAKKQSSLNKVSNNHSKSSVNSSSNNNDSLGLVGRRERPSRACTQRAAERMQAAAAAEAAAHAAERRLKKKAASRREKLTARLVREELDEDAEEDAGSDAEEEEEDEEGEEGGGTVKQVLSSKEVTQLVGEPESSQLPRWSIRGMWQLASILNFLNVFRHLLNIKAEFSVEEFETALITPNNTLGDIHIPLLKSIPPVTRMALGHGTWVTVLCRKLRDWWLWVAEGEIPIVASHGAEIEAYNSLDPAVRVIILKAICDIRVEQEDIRNYIDNSIKHGTYLSTFRKERIGGDSHGVSYWYEDDPIIGHRLYREFRKIEVKKGKGRNIPPIADACYQWETVATSFDEFQDVSEKLFSSKNRTEVSVGKKLRKDMLPEIEKLHKKREKLLKKQHRQAMMLDNMMNIDGLAGGRSLRDRKPVTYTFDDYDRSITEAIKVTKKNQASGEFMTTRREGLRHEASMNGSRWDGPSDSFGELSPKSPDYDGSYDENGANQLDRSNRRRQRPERYSAREFVEAVSDNDADFDSDDDIVGEVVYDDEYLRKRKQRRKMSSSSEGDDEYHADDDNVEDEEEEEEEEDVDSFSASDESDAPRKFKKLRGRTRRETTKLRSVGNLQSGLRRSNRATRNRIDYRQYELSDSESESMKPGKSNTLPDHMNDSENEDKFSGGQDSDEEIMESADKFSAGSQDSEEEENAENADKFSPASQDSEEENVDNEEDAEEMKVDEQQETEPAEEETVKEEEGNGNHLPEKEDSPKQVDSGEGVGKRRFLDLNELAPGSGFDDGPNSMKDEDTRDF